MSGKKCFALSSYEIGITSAESNVAYPEGAKLDYFISGDTDAARGKRLYNIDKGLSGAYSWWTRTARTDDAEMAFAIKDTSPAGGFTTMKCSSQLVIRPAFILPFDAKVDKDNNIIV